MQIGPRDNEYTYSCARAVKLCKVLHIYLPLICAVSLSSASFESVINLLSLVSK